jgi:threonine dehydrogenase-like Zn-dependent dehydrogenase
MKALCWHGKGDIRYDTVPDPKIEHPRDAVIKVTACAICGSDLHLFNGVIPTMESGDVVGHETMGEVVEVGSENKKLKVGDRVVIPFTIACGECFFCKRGFYSGCERSNPNKPMAEKLWGHSPAGLFGYSHMLGGYAGGQAEYLRVPYADVGPIKVPDSLTDEQVLFLSDIFPTGYMAADFCNIQGGDTIAIWGCGPLDRWPSAPLSCSARSASSPSTQCRSGWPWRVKPAQSPSISTRTMSMSASRADAGPRGGCLHRCRRHGSGRDGQR